MKRFNYLIILILFIMIDPMDLYMTELPDPKIADVNFIVTDKADLPVDAAEIYIKSKDYRKRVVTDQKGKCSVQLLKDRTYDVIVKKYNSKFKFKNLIKIPSTISRLKINQPLQINLYTKYIRKYSLTGVFFYLNKAKLKPVSFKALKDLVRDLKSNPSMIIEVAGHTDDKGDDKHNMRLSKKRAEAVRRYLIKQGINKNRITAKGYGEISPIVSNRTEIGRQRNRRVEIRVVKE